MEKELLIERVKDACNLRGLTQNKAFLAASVGKDFISNIKKGCVPSIELVATLANYLDVSLDYLCGRTNNKEVCPDVPQEINTLSPTALEVANIFDTLTQGSREKLKGYLYALCEQERGALSKSEPHSEL